MLFLYTLDIRSLHLEFCFSECFIFVFVEISVFVLVCGLFSFLA